MAVSILLAQILGLYLVIVGTAMLVNKRYYDKAISSLFEHKGNMLLLAIFTLVLGILMVVFHNIWTQDWRVLITILCWITFIKGIIRLLFPVVIFRCSKIVNHNYFYYPVFVIILTLGIYLLYMGYWGYLR